MNPKKKAPAATEAQTEVSVESQLKDNKSFAEKQTSCKSILPSVDGINDMNNENLLDCILAQIKPVNFVKTIQPLMEEWQQQLAEVQDEKERFALHKQIRNAKITTTQKLVVVCEEVLEAAKQLNYGLAKKSGSVFMYNGCFWSSIGNDMLQYFLAACAERMGIEHYLSQQFKFQNNLLLQFVVTAYLKKITSNNRISINLLNGTFDITSNGKRRLREFRQGDFLTYQLGFEYDKKATCPMFNDFINEVLPDKDPQHVLSEFIGYVFVKQLKLEKALILYGSGANGKSVIFDIISALLGRDNVSSYSMSELCGENGYYRAKVDNKLLNYASEIGGKTESDTFKKLASGEPISARLPYGEPFEIENYARFIFNANTLPKDIEMTNAFFRRFLIIPFNVTIPEERQDKELASKIIANELPGILNWVLEGVDRLLAQKRFTKCDLVERELEQFKKESDTIHLFLDDENYQLSTDLYKSLMELYNEYRSFCCINGYRSLSKKNMAKRLKNLGFEDKRLSGGMYVYIEKKVFE